ncbi:farnesol dehydrogenase-like [Sitophilus oryzae]|uniref:Farnesol dehydrogenase-like n=1 Tax=Sitophilus oryzae TaxID=7048 RepID=A0A6J2XU59_SITOR|nr:farnesol dehydrogenase-like [Sitophilus oryzae]
MKMDQYEGKVAIVTGASAGIGKAIVEALVRHGVLVAGLARRVERVEQLAEDLSSEKGQLKAFKCDMTKEEEITSTIQQVIEEMGNIHILVNNAGLLQHTDLINGDTEKWKTTLDTNVLGLCIATREAIQNMKANDIQGHIIHINSVFGHVVPDFVNVNVYPASKFAVTALAENLRKDITRDQLPIKITSISPGYVKTEFEEVGGLPVLTIPPLYGPDIAEAVVYALSTPAHVNVNEITLQAVGS